MSNQNLFKLLNNKEIPIPTGILIILSISIIFVFVGILFSQYAETQKQEVLTPETEFSEKQAKDGITDPATKDWKTYRNEEYGFEMKYPEDFFTTQPLQPKTKTIQCDYVNFVDNCPTEITTINDIPFCLQKTGGAAAGTAYVTYNYTTVRDKKCFIASFTVPYPNCSNYLPIENQKIQQMYDKCKFDNEITKPKIINQMFSSFRFIEKRVYFEESLKPANPKHVYAPFVKEIPDDLRDIIVEHNIKIAEDYYVSEDLKLKEKFYNKIASFTLAGEKIDLDGDEIKEYITYPQSLYINEKHITSFTGTGGGPINVFGFIQGKWELIGDFSGNRGEKINSRHTKGYVNLVSHTSMGASLSVIREYAWNGEKYELIKKVTWGEGTENPSGPPKEYLELWEQKG